jgi:hypothetical protein
MYQNRRPPYELPGSQALVQDYAGHACRGDNMSTTCKSKAPAPAGGLTPAGRAIWRGPSLASLGRPARAPVRSARSGRPRPTSAPRPADPSRIQRGMADCSESWVPPAELRGPAPNRRRHGQDHRPPQGVIAATLAGGMGGGGGIKSGAAAQGSAASNMVCHTPCAVRAALVCLRVPASGNDGHSVQ